jgi:hypothetical protein
MNYYIKRGDKEYGPYSLAVLQQYVQQGNISRDDLARSEAMTDWTAVGSIIGNVQVQGSTGFGAAPAGPAPTVVTPPGLHWGIVVVLGIVTFGLFWIIWLFVQAAWIRKVVPESKAIFFLVGYVVCIFSAVGLDKSGAGVLIQLAGMVVYIMGVFKMRSDIEEYYATLNPSGLNLSGAMTFFFNTAYFQYHLPEIRDAQNYRATAVAAGQ